MNYVDCIQADTGKNMSVDPGHWASTALMSLNTGIYILSRVSAVWVIIQSPFPEHSSLNFAYRRIIQPES